MKTYKGWELIKAIQDGEIKEGTKFLDSWGEYIYKKNVTTEELTLFKVDGNILTIPDYSYFVENGNEFELIEEQQDIQAIEELDEEIAWSDGEKTLALTINELIKAIKQLDKRTGD